MVMTRYGCVRDIVPTFFLAVKDGVKPIHIDMRKWPVPSDDVRYIQDRKPVEFVKCDLVKYEFVCGCTKYVGWADVHEYCEVRDFADNDNHKGQYLESLETYFRTTYETIIGLAERHFKLDDTKKVVPWVLGGVKSADENDILEKSHEKDTGCRRHAK